MVQWSSLRWVVSLVLALIISGISAPLPKHWHESTGFGTGIKAGLDGKVIKVTDLNKDGPGSLAAALNESGPRLIVFEVGGVIDFESSTFKVTNGQVTIAGETAPSPGISLIRVNFRVPANNVLVSHINIMLGDSVQNEWDTGNIDGDSAVFNHVGIYWSVDENFSMDTPHYVTAYKCIIAEGMAHSFHQDGEHSKGSLIIAPTNLSLIGCLYAHNSQRSPQAGDGGTILIANQVNYNWATGWDEPSPNWFNFVVHVDMPTTFVGNVALQGPQSVGKIYLDAAVRRTASAFMKDNIIIDKEGNNLDVYDPTDVKVLGTPPLWPTGFEPLPAHESLYDVLRTVGSRPGDRDFHNARAVRTVADGNGKLVDSQKEVGGYPKYSPTSRTLQVPDGFEARRKWLDSLEDAMAVDTKIDLVEVV